MKDYQQQSEDYLRIEQAIYYLEQHYRRQPPLKEIAESVHLSEYHFQRLFTRWVGISPKRFLQFLTKENAKQLLENSTSLLEASIETGLSGPGRLHDLFVKCEAVTPGQYKQRGEGLEIRWGVHPTPFGECLLAVTPLGICGLQFLSADARIVGGRPMGKRETALSSLQVRWQKAHLIEDQAGTRGLIEPVFDLRARAAAPLALHLQGTNFQIKVWEALLRIPAGRVVSYGGLAGALGTPHAARAVGAAVGHNPVAYLVPCHRVIRSLGQLGEYQSGRARKMAILGWEMAAAAEIR